MRRRPPPWVAHRVLPPHAPTPTAPTTTRTRWPPGARRRGFRRRPPQPGGPALLLGPASLGPDLRHPLAYVPRLPAAEEGCSCSASTTRPPPTSTSWRSSTGTTCGERTRTPPSPAGPPPDRAWWDDHGRPARGWWATPRPASSHRRLRRLPAGRGRRRARPLPGGSAMNGPLRVPILVYHHVYPQGAPELDPAADGAGILGEAEFSRQMLHLVGRGWTVVSTSSIADWLAGEAELPARSVALHLRQRLAGHPRGRLAAVAGAGHDGDLLPHHRRHRGRLPGRQRRRAHLTEGVVEKPFMTWGTCGGCWPPAGRSAATRPPTARWRRRSRPRARPASSRRCGPPTPSWRGTSAGRPSTSPTPADRGRKRPTAYWRGTTDAAAVARGVAGALDLHGPRHLAAGRRLSEHRPQDRLRRFRADLRGGRGGPA